MTDDRALALGGRPEIGAWAEVLRERALDVRGRYRMYGRYGVYVVAMAVGPRAGELRQNDPASKRGVRR